MKILWTEYLMVWALAATLWFTLPQGTMVNSAMVAYAAECACIVFTMLAIWLSLKMFSTKGVRERIQQGGAPAFRRLSEIRLSLLAIVLFADLGVQAATLDKIGAFAALITAIALLFITPSARERQALCEPVSKQSEVDD